MDSFRLRNTIIFVTILLFIYNVVFTFMVVNLTEGTNRILFLVLLCVDYIIIFYFILQVAHEIKFEKVPIVKKKNRWMVQK